MIDAERTMEWLDRMTDWCQRHNLKTEVTRCPDEGWGINITFADSVGPFYAFITPPARRNKETLEEWLERGEQEARKDIAQTRSHRIKRINGLARVA